MASTPVTDARWKAYQVARGYLKRHEPEVMAEGERLYLRHGGQRAMGYVDGYRWAMDQLAGTPGETT